MKEIQATRKVKEAISDHFRRGGNASNLPAELARAPLAVIAECKLFVEEKRKAKQKPLPSSAQLDDQGSFP